MASSKKKICLKGNAANADDDDSVDYIGKNCRNRKKRTEVRRYFKIYYPPQKKVISNERENNFPALKAKSY